MKPLFDAALQRYSEKIVGMCFSELEKLTAGINKVRELIEFYGRCEKKQRLAKKTCWAPCSVRSRVTVTGTPGEVPLCDITCECLFGKLKH